MLSLTYIEIHETVLPMQAIVGKYRNYELLRRCSEGRLLAIEGVVQGSQCGDDRGFRAQDQSPERSFEKSAGFSRCEFRIGPAALGTDRQRRFCRLPALQNFSERRS